MEPEIHQTLGALELRFEQDGGEQRVDPLRQNRIERRHGGAIFPHLVDDLGIHLDRGGEVACNRVRIIRQNAGQ